MQNPEETPEEEEKMNPEEPEGEEQGAEREEGTGGETKAESPAPVADDSIKIVINMKGNRATIGVQSPGADPVFGTAEGDQSSIFVATAILLDKAKEQWKTNRLNPKSSVKPAVAAAPRSRSAPASPKPAGPQNALF